MDARRKIQLPREQLLRLYGPSAADGRQPVATTVTVATAVLAVAAAAIAVATAEPFAATAVAATAEPFAAAAAAVTAAAFATAAIALAALAVATTAIAVAATALANPATALTNPAAAAAPAAVSAYNDLRLQRRRHWPWLVDGWRQPDNLAVCVHQERRRDVVQWHRPLSRRGWIGIICLRRGDQ
eukprot:scaffold74106_cov48-Phaeocystis_antarctica.AAC.1